MRRKMCLALTVFLLVTPLAPIPATARSSRTGECQPAISKTAAARVVTVEIRELKFQPAVVTVHESETVEWKNEDSVPHTATENADAKKPAFDSGYLQNGATWRYEIGRAHV